jgi:hypothetical protein
MEPLPTLKHLEYMETGFEVSKILAQAGFSMEKPAFSITWGQVAEQIAQTLADHGLCPDRFSEDFLIDLAQSVQKVLQNEDVLCWRSSIHTLTTEHPTFLAFMSSTHDEDDEGSHTEQFENATRIGDDGAHWVDGGASADLFDEF